MSPWLNQSQIAVSSCRLEAAILSTIDLDLTAPILQSFYQASLWDAMPSRDVNQEAIRQVFAVPAIFAARVACNMESEIKRPTSLGRKGLRKEREKEAMPLLWFRSRIDSVRRDRRA